MWEFFRIQDLGTAIGRRQSLEADGLKFQIRAIEVCQDVVLRWRFIQVFCLSSSIGVTLVKEKEGTQKWTFSFERYRFGSKRVEFEWC